LSITDEWQLDEENIEWQKLALCNGTNIPNAESDPFFQGYETKLHIARSTDEMCLHCPVTKQCFNFGVENKETGVWGGFYLDRGKIDKNKNAHKTEEVKRALYNKITAGDDE